MTYFKFILIGLLTVFIAYISLCLFTPDRVVISQSIIINKPVDSVFQHVIEVNNWPNWHPWFRKGNIHPDRVVEITPKLISWQAPEKKGGKIKVVSSTANESIQTELTYEKEEYQKVNQGEFLFEAMGSQTKVSWILVGTEYPFLLKPATILLKEIFTKNFEMGLKNLKALSEGQPLPAVSRADA